MGTESKRERGDEERPFFLRGGTRKSKLVPTETSHSCVSVNGMRKPQEPKVKNPTLRTGAEDGAPVKSAPNEDDGTLWLRNLRHARNALVDPFYAEGMVGDVVL